MKTGFRDLDNIIKLNAPQLIVCSSAYYVIEIFLTNVLKNISVDQKISTLYIDNNLMQNCTEDIEKEREIIFENKMHEMQTGLMIRDVSDTTLDDIVSNITMLDRDQLTNNRLVESVLTQEEIKKLSKDNKIELIDIVDGRKYICKYDLFNTEERKRIKEADILLKNSPLFLKHIKKIALDDFKELCYEYRKKNKINIIILNDIETIDHSSETEILNELRELSRKLNIIIIIGYKLIKKDIISLETELIEIKQKCDYIDTLLFFQDGWEGDVLYIWIMKNINNTLGKIDLLHIERYNKLFNLE